MTNRTLRSALAAVAFLPAASVVGTFVPHAADASHKGGLHLLRVGFACCNLRYEGDWIGDGN